ncbi:hypothetical protein Efla_007014 [Eimeria flavescens]
MFLRIRSSGIGGDSTLSVDDLPQGEERKDFFQEVFLRKKQRCLHPFMKLQVARHSSLAAALAASSAVAALLPQVSAAEQQEVPMGSLQEQPAELFLAAAKTALPPGGRQQSKGLRVSKPRAPLHLPVLLVYTAVTAVAFTLLLCVRGFRARSRAEAAFSRSLAAADNADCDLPSPSQEARPAVDGNDARESALLQLQRLDLTSADGAGMTAADHQQVAQARQKIQELQQKLDGADEGTPEAELARRALLAVGYTPRQAVRAAFLQAERLVTPQPVSCAAAAALAAAHAVLGFEVASLGGGALLLRLNLRGRIALSRVMWNLEAQADLLHKHVYSTLARGSLSAAEAEIKAAEQFLLEMDELEAAWREAFGEPSPTFVQAGDRLRRGMMQARNFLEEPLEQEFKTPLREDDRLDPDYETRLREADAACEKRGPSSFEEDRVDGTAADGPGKQYRLLAMAPTSDSCGLSAEDRKKIDDARNRLDDLLDAVQQKRNLLALLAECIRLDWANVGTVPSFRRRSQSVGGVLLQGDLAFHKLWAREARRGLAAGERLVEAASYSHNQPAFVLLLQTQRALLGAAPLNQRAAAAVVAADVILGNISHGDLPQPTEVEAAAIADMLEASVRQARNFLRVAPAEEGDADLHRAAQHLATKLQMLEGAARGFAHPLVKAAADALAQARDALEEALPDFAQSARPDTPLAEAINALLASFGEAPLQQADEEADAAAASSHGEPAPTTEPLQADEATAAPAAPQAETAGFSAAAAARTAGAPQADGPDPSPTAPQAHVAAATPAALQADTPTGPQADVTAATATAPQADRAAATRTTPQTPAAPQANGVATSLAAPRADDASEKARALTVEQLTRKLINTSHMLSAAAVATVPTLLLNIMLAETDYVEGAAFIASASSFTLPESASKEEKESFYSALSKSKENLERLRFQLQPYWRERCGRLAHRLRNASSKLTKIQRSLPISGSTASLNLMRKDRLSSTEGKALKALRKSFGLIAEARDEVKVFSRLGEHVALGEPAELSLQDLVSVRWGTSADARSLAALLLSPVKLGLEALISSESSEADSEGGHGGGGEFKKQKEEKRKEAERSMLLKKAQLLLNELKAAGYPENLMQDVLTLLERAERRSSTDKSDEGGDDS